MTSTLLSQQLRIGHSPDPDDAFMFYGFASGQATVEGHEIDHVLHDIQTLNEMAAGEDPLEVTAMSLHAFFDLENRYEMLQVGSSVGRGYGPKVISRVAMSIEDLKDARVAMPGLKTTATLAARHLLPKFDEIHMDFTEIMDTVASGSVDAGVIIHEGQLTYAERGFSLIADLGVLFATAHHGLPLPLGVNCVRRDLDPVLKQEIARAYRKSVEIALTQREQAVQYSLRYARGLAEELADRFVGMYVNADSLAFAADLIESVDVLRVQYERQQLALHKGDLA